MKLSTALKLGRVSNIPTVWSNCLAAGVIAAGADLSLHTLLTVTLAISLMYIGGMFLNDAYDADWDITNKADRPIAQGEVEAPEVWRYGWSLLTSGPILIILLSLSLSNSAFWTIISSLALALAIVAYDALHKRVSYAPWLMGSCRLFVYLTAGFACGEFSPLLCFSGLSLMAYIVGLTYIARSEHLNKISAWWPLVLFLAPLLLVLYLALGNSAGLPTPTLPAAPASTPIALIFLALLVAWLIYLGRYLIPGSQRRIPKAIGGLLAGIPLIDAALLASIGYWTLACIAVLAFVATLLAHRKIAGT